MEFLVGNTENLEVEAVDITLESRFAKVGNGYAAGIESCIEIDCILVVWFFERYQFGREAR